jgi:hypothetical protein
MVGWLCQRERAETMEDFTTAELQTGETTIFARSHGSGPQVLLLHGFPQTHPMSRTLLGTGSSFSDPGVVSEDIIILVS